MEYTPNLEAMRQIARAQTAQAQAQRAQAEAINALTEAVISAGNDIANAIIEGRLGGNDASMGTAGD